MFGTEGFFICIELSTTHYCTFTCIDMHLCVECQMYRAKHDHDTKISTPECRAAGENLLNKILEFE